MSKTTLLALLSAFATIITAKEAIAEWSFPASECVFEQWDGAPNVDIIADGSLRVYATISDSYYFYCPITDTSTSNHADEKTTMYVVDNHVDSGTPIWYEQVNCALYSCGATSLSCDWDDEATTGNSSTPQALTFDAVTWYGASFIICNIPNYHSPSWSGLTQYRTRQS